MATRVEATPHAAATTRAGAGLLSWLSTVDHKRIGILYGTTAIFFLFVGRQGVRHWCRHLPSDSWIEKSSVGTSELHGQQRSGVAT